MKHYLPNSLRALLLPLAMLLSLPMLAIEIGGINYELVAETRQATVVSKSDNNHSVNIVIPASVEHDGIVYSVTGIGRNAFATDSVMTSVTIPGSVTYIEESAFSGCSALTSVHILDIAAWCNISFVSYDSNPLWYAKHLYIKGKEVKDLVIPNSVTSIRDYTFLGCSGLTSVVIPNSVTSIEDYAFYGCI